MTANRRARWYTAAALLAFVLPLTAFCPAGAQQTPPAASTSDKTNSSSPAATASSTSTGASFNAHEFLTATMDLGDGHKVWHPTRKELGLRVTAPPSTPAGAPQVSIDNDQLTAYLTKLAPVLHRKPQHAHIVFPANYPLGEVDDRSSGVPVPVKIGPPLPGVTLNIDDSITAIKQAIGADPTTTHIALAVTETPVPTGGPDLTGINARIAHFVTHFNPGEAGRTQTVRLAISLIDGHIVAPGEVFSVNQTVGERTAARGFGMGIVFVNGHLDKQLGGGMCQVATTLFNCVLLADLKVVLRFQHVRTVPYVNPGQDATVYWGEKDFKFQNNTQTPIYISYKTTATHAVCDLYGMANPAVKVRIDDDYRRLGPRDYTAVLRRYETKGGHTSVNYTAYSDYKWTPSLDYTF
jgi:vancomycin resistance protein YoaR